VEEINCVGIESGLNLHPQMYAERISADANWKMDLKKNKIGFSGRPLGMI
jgi:hypothetical protein